MTGENISIVIPTHNRCGWLKETVASVFAQTIDNWELIIVDDASGDETWPWLQGLSDSRVKKLRLELPAERSRARNLGLQSANGQFILFLDDDDLLPEKALQLHLESFEKYPVAIASIGGYTLFNEEGTFARIQVVGRTTLHHIEHDLLFGWMATAGQSLFRTRNMRALNGWDVSYSFAEDHDLWLRMARLGPVALRPEILLSYRAHGQIAPDNGERLMTEFRERAVSRTSGREHEVGKRILRARTLMPMASEHYQRAETFKALGLYLKIAGLAPSLLRSPLTQREILLPILKCLFGTTGLRAARHIRTWLRRKLGYGSSSIAN